MDYQFPQQLFPSFFNCGPPDSVLKHSAGTWGSYDRVRPLSGSGPLSSWTFTSSRHIRGETWRHTEPVPIPLLSPKNSLLWDSSIPDPLDFTQHMQNFFMDNCHDAFGCMGEILFENFDFKKGRKSLYQRDSIHMWKVKNFLEMLKVKTCPQSYSSKSMALYSTLLSDVVPSVPPELLGSLLFEELTEQRERLLFCEAVTGGALNFIPFSQTGSGPDHGCLIYPGNQGFDRLNFHKVVLEHHEGKPSFLDVTSSVPLGHQLKGPIRQISSTSLFNECCVAVRSDRLCGVWRFSETNEPRLLQVINTRELATCISVSPHVLGEILVTSESGEANLWTVGKGMQKVREEDGNLYFNAKSPWRWCEFSAHPRVIVYADRTGAELTDIRVNTVSGHTLFRISKTSECRSGERLIQAKYLGDVHPFHHLITTQYSAYIMDERFPCIPMLKWDTMMQSPAMFCHIVPGSASSALGQCRSAKVLLGSHSSQEITLLQYSGGKAEACFSQGPPQALLKPRNSLKNLPVQIPHRSATASNRLSTPAAGLTCIQMKREGNECLFVLQLTEAGDIFYQILKPELPDVMSRPLAGEDTPIPSQPAKDSLQLSDSQPLVSESSSDDDMIGPTQVTAMPLIAETPEREKWSTSMLSDSESEGRRQHLKQCLQVIINDDPELYQVSGSDAEENEVTSGNKRDDITEPGETGCDSRCLDVQQTTVKISKRALTTWKHWLQKLMQETCGQKPRTCQLQHFTVTTKDLFHLPDHVVSDSTEEDNVQRLKQDLRACMSKQSLLIHSALSTSVIAPDVVPVPNQVNTTVWRDQLSQRLTLSWQGEEAWRMWWEEQLGLNREKKVEALKRKRRREKEAKRATGQRLELSGSFTSSLSYQSELDDFSDSTGWSSATSQGMLSDTEGTGLASQLEGFVQHGTPRPTTPSSVHNEPLIFSPTSTPQSVKLHQDGKRTPSSSQTLPLSRTVNHDFTPRSRGKGGRSADDYLSSLFGTQDEPSQNYYFPHEESSEYHHPPPAASSSSNSQLRSSQSAPLTSLRVDLSKDNFCWTGSQGRSGLSQASQSSQPKVKKSRMGF